MLQLSEQGKGWLAAEAKAIADATCTLLSRTATRAAATRGTAAHGEAVEDYRIAEAGMRVVMEKLSSMERLLTQEDRWPIADAQTVIMATWCATGSFVGDAAAAH